MRAKLHQAKCSGSWVINSALDFGQLQTLIVNISGTDQAIDKRKTALSTTILSTFVENNLVNFGPLTKMTLTFDLWPWNWIGFMRLSRYVFMHNIIKLSAAVYQLSCTQSFLLYLAVVKNPKIRGEMSSLQTTASIHCNACLLRTNWIVSVRLDARKSIVACLCDKYACYTILCLNCPY